MRLASLLSSVIVLSLGGLLVSCTCPFHRPGNGQAVKAGYAGLDYFSKRITARQAASMGFSSTRDLAVADLGPAYRVHLLSWQRAADYVPNDDPRRLLTPSNRWLLPIAHGGTIHGLMMIDANRGDYRAVGLGPPGLARSLAGLRQRWPLAQGYRLTYAVLGRVDMVFVSQGSVVRIMPLPSTNALLDLGEPAGGVYGLYEPQAIVSRLVEAVPAENAGSGR